MNRLQKLWIGLILFIPIFAFAQNDKPDLVITGIKYSTKPVYLNHDISFSVIVENKGKAETPSGSLTNVSLSIDGNNYVNNELHLQFLPEKC
ncbi:MAG: hypothetical protein HC906_15025 [Bacteroidales bacterium]|nr:hypothetical protein [Bacteroidales bacterium]